ncbi:MAG: cytidylate kinase-like family protein [Eubacteriales bacterium]|nr:cytidylate kinase-like family protein [Eubacteriales bacterium]
MKTITISRQYGSGGRQVASMLAEKLGIPYYDSNLLLIAAEKYGISPGLLKEYDEKKNSSFLFGIAMLADGYTNQDRVMLPYKLYQAQCDSMKRLSQEGPCVFVGRCADQILKDECELLRVFIYASDMEERISRIMKVDQISQKEAPGRIAQKDRQRKDYYYFHTGQEWGKKENYDLCLNTSTLGYEGCVDIIERIVKEQQ